MFGFTSTNPLLIAAAVKIVSRDDCRTALGILVRGTVPRIVAALDTGTRTKGFDKFNVVVVTQTNAALGISHSTDTPAGVVLTSCIVSV